MPFCGLGKQNSVVFDFLLIFQFILRFSEKTLKTSDIKKRYMWHWLQIIALLSVGWAYNVYGSLFVKAPNDFQWILAIINPFVRDAFTNFLVRVTSKARGQKSKGKKSLKLLAQHYVTTRHTIFLAVMVGSVATPVSSVCIMSVDFLKTLHSVWNAIKKKKVVQNIEGNYARHFMSILYFDYKLILNCHSKPV